MRYYTSFKPQRHSWDFAIRAMKAGISGFEVFNYQSYLSPEVYEEFLELLFRIKDQLEAEFAVHAPMQDVHLGSRNRQVREVAFEEVKSSIDLARELEASVVVIHPAPAILAMPEGEWVKEQYELPAQKRDSLAEQEGYLVRALKDLADYAPDILLGVENLVFPHELYRSPESLVELIRKVNRTNVGLTLDSGHAHIAGYRSAEFMHPMANHLFHIHLHDNHGVFDEHLPLGEGTIDYVAVIQSLKQVEYNGAITLEFATTSPDAYADYFLDFD